MKVRAADLASGPLEHLCELTESEARIAFEKMARYLRRKLPRDGGNVLEVGYGPSKAAELDEPELASYNGRNGGKFWQYFDLGEFNRQLNALGTDMGSGTERQCVDALRKTSNAIRKWSRAVRDTIRSYAGPQCFPHLSDAKRTGLEKPGVAEARRAVVATERCATTGLPAHMHESVPDQLTGCWLKCGKCSALRWVDRWSMASLGSDAYLKPIDGVDASKWKVWLGEARSRYDAWNQTLSSGCGVDGELVLEGGCEADDEIGCDGDDGVSDGECGDGGVVPKAVLGIVGSYQPREADGNYMTPAEQLLQERLCAGGVSSDLVAFDCGMLVTKDCVEGALEGERQSKWRPVRCLDDDCGTGDRDDYRTLIESVWTPADFMVGDPVYIVDSDNLQNGPYNSRQGLVLQLRRLKRLSFGGFSMIRCVTGTRATVKVGSCASCGVKKLVPMIWKRTWMWCLCLLSVPTSRTRRALCV